MTKILIIRFSSIGDIVLTTPVIRCVKKQWEGDVEVHYLTKKGFSSLLDKNPYLSKVYSIKEHVNEVVDQLKMEHYDYIIDLHRNIRSLQVKKALKALSFSFDKLNLQKWLLVNFKINRLPDKHIVDRYLETVLAFGIKNDGKGLDYFVPEKEKFDLSQLPDSFQKKYIAFAIGGTYATKKLPEHKIIELCKGLHLPIILLGGKEDIEVGKNIESSLTSKNIYNACGTLNLHQSASVVEQSACVISHDTGMMHIAAALKKPIVSIWGNTVPELGMYPYQTGFGLRGEGTIIENRSLSCRPCSKLGYNTCPKKHFKCMEDIENKRVVDVVKSLVEI